MISTVILMVVLVILSAYFSATETAFSSLSKTRLRAMAEEERGHVRKLSALYFLLFGRKPQILSGAAETGRSFLTALRSAYAGAVTRSRAYREAAKRWEQHSVLFNELANDEDRHARTLQTITAGILR